MYLPLEFVLVEYEGKQVIPARTNTSMDAEDIITAYAHRFKIEAMFREFKHQFRGFVAISGVLLCQSLTVTRKRAPRIPCAG